jgi:chromosome segregation protein
MTKINKIVCHGFKSFAKRTEILFGGDFNCVLGPNGSGKSNILDALCFVLGKSSTKSLRAEKSANLIYNGGKTKKPAKSGEVSIFFDNNNKVFPTEDKEVKISRIVKQNGQSIYKINDKVRTRQQILDLMSLAKINPDGHNIILQGDIVRFTEMPSVERRQLIEEIAGISVYEEKKKKAINELEKVDSKLNNADIVLEERKTYLKELKKDRDQALKYKEMSDRIKENQASYIKIQIDKKEKELNDLQKKQDTYKKQLDKINEQITKLREENEEKKKIIDKISEEIEQKGEKEQIRLNKEIENLKIELTKDSSRIDTCKNEIAKITNRKKDLKNSLEEIENKIKDLRNKRVKLEKEITSKQKEKQLYEQKLINFKKKHKLEDTHNIEKSIEEVDKRGEELQKEIHELKEKQHSILRENDLLEHQINTIDEKINKVLQIEKEHKEQINSLKRKREEFKKATLELNKCLDYDSNLAAQLSNARKKLHNANEEVAKLRARNITIRESVSGDLAVKKILQLKNKMRGIYGTIADLGKVSTKFSLALETAAGPRTKSIVVEDEKVAVECIKYLKQNKLGRASFLPLNKIKTPPMRPEVVEIADARGSYGMAMDLISYDPKFKKVFSYVFANTIVVDNIDVAKRLGIGKAKMVTLDGDLTEFSGVMHGGFMQKKKQSYGFKEKEIIKDLEEYEELSANLQKTIKELDEKREKNEKRISELRNFKASLEGDIIKTEKSLHLESGDIELSKQQKKDLIEKKKILEKNERGILNKISELTKELTNIKIEKQKLRTQISQLREPTLIAELQTFEEKKSSLNNEIIIANSEIKNIDIQINTIFNNEKEKILQILKQIDKEEEAFNNEIKELSSGFREKEKVLKIKENSAKKFYIQFRTLFDTRNKINEELNKNNNIIEKKLENSRGIEIKWNTFSLKIAELKASLAGLNQEFEQYHGVKIITNKSEEEFKKEINKFERMRQEIGNVNMRALDIYEDVEKQYNGLLAKKEKLIKEKDDVIIMMNEIETKKKELFMKTFNVLNSNFKKFFSMLSTKGEVYLDLENRDNPFEAGLNIKVKITGTKFLDIRSLSGGEKTLTALAFIFAIQEHEPASFYVLDEVDAALDKHNSEKFAKLIGKYANKAQYIIISHNDAVISEASNLYGVSMDEHGVSNVVSLKI